MERSDRHLLALHRLTFKAVGQRGKLWGVHRLLGTTFDAEWPANKPLASTLVFVGNNLAYARFQGRLDTCRIA